MHYLHMGANWKHPCLGPLVTFTPKEYMHVLQNILKNSDMGLVKNVIYWLKPPFKWIFLPKMQYPHTRLGEYENQRWPCHILWLNVTIIKRKNLVWVLWIECGYYCRKKSNGFSELYVDIAFKEQKIVVGFARPM